MTAEGGRFSFGSERESENAPLADRCFPTFALFIAASYTRAVECAALTEFPAGLDVSDLAHVGP